MVTRCRSHRNIAEHETKWQRTDGREGALEVEDAGSGNRFHERDKEGALGQYKCDMLSEKTRRRNAKDSNKLASLTVPRSADMGRRWNGLRCAPLQRYVLTIGW